MPVEESASLGEFIFLFSFFGFTGVFLVITIAIFVMHFLMPKEVLKKYFKPPYFSDLECELFTGFPYAPIRTIMFMRAIAFPASGKKRGITEARRSAPASYRLASKLVTVSILIFGISLLLVILSSTVFFLITDAESFFSNF